MARNRKRARDRRPRPPQQSGPGPSTNGRHDEEGVPEPLEHASPDTELAEAQLALGRPELTEAGDAEEAEHEEELADGHGGAVAVPGAHAPERRPAPGNRLINFLQGSWRELQRVQWPDRRQVMQATGVVLGFVIVAGVFLGAADLVAQKVVNLIIEGHT